MEYSFENGFVSVKGAFYEEVPYNASNEKISAVFDGKGAVRYYAAANEECYISEGYGSVMAFYPPYSHSDTACKRRGRERRRLF